MGDLQELNGGWTENVPVIGANRWAQAEKITRKIIREVQPTAVSEERRKEVIDYVQRLIRSFLGCEVFPYGSVPLKTYLPDGDIDLTAFGGVNNEDSLSTNIAAVLEREEQNEAAEFVVKDVQLIRAEVKLVKCIVQNIVVDISINQIGGLCTLCFLEQVDRLIAKDHLFKRSIILIKAWCYYESRILGAHHALISTYALETLVLYIFHLFHSMLDGPLAVLYKFLDYFSKFDWENYCISLTGPVHVSSLPEIIAETPENGGSDLLLTPDFLRNCVDMFHVPSRGGESNQRTFQEKHLNIVDPLKENNNLGRSVSKGNFYRIKSAFTYGARKLGQILLQSEDNIGNELHNFFMNTLERHGHGERPDVQDSDLSERNLACTYVPENSCTYRDVAFDSRVVSTEVAKENGNHEHTSDCNGSDVDLEKAELSGSQNRAHKITSDISGVEESVSPRGIPYHAPHLFFIHSHDEMVKSPSKKLSNSDECDMDRRVNSLGSPKSNHSLPDLTGDYEIHINCLRIGRWWYEVGGGIPVMPPQPMMLPHFQMKMPYEAMMHPPHFKRNGYSHGNVNDIVQNSAFYAVNPLAIPGVAVGFEDAAPKPRGTGTYFPNTNRPPQGMRPSGVISRNHPTRSPRSNVRTTTFPETGNHDRSSCISPTFSPRGKGHSFTNGSVPVSEGFIELSSGQQKHSSCSSPNSSPAFKPAFSREDRFSMRSAYRLKDEDDFPPLSNRGDPLVE